MRRVAIVLLLLALCLWGAMSLGWPHGLDQGLYSWVGSAIADGGVPYRDAWEVKGPLTYMLNAFAQVVLGHNEWGIRLVDFLLLAVALWAAHATARRAGDRLGGAFAAVLYFGLYATTGFWNTAQPDGWAATLLLVALAQMSRPGFAERRLWLALASAAVGTACMLKPPFAVFALPIGIVAVMRCGCRPRRCIRPLLVASTWFLVPVLAVLAWFACHPGGLASFAEVQLQFNPSAYVSTVVAEEHVGFGKAFSLLFLYEPAMLACLPAFVVGMVVVWQRDRAMAVALMLSFVLSIVITILQAKYFAYHWHPLRAVYAIGTGVGLGALAALWRAARERAADRRDATHLGAIAWASVVLAVLLNLRVPIRSVVKWGTAVAGRRSWTLYYEQVGGAGQGDTSYLATRAAAKYLAGRTAKDETVLVWGFNALINYLADRRSPTRFGYSLPFMRGPDSPYLEQYLREFIDALRQSPPAYIVLSATDKHAFQVKNSKEYLKDFPELHAFVTHHYVHDTTVAGFEMWRRVEPR
ncbi:glycosyltransferase family 39 protein [bacterium]|nr:glycosyltransferase family 39 protein [bacterium]